ncbi:MAG: tRNA (adenosine(37)-N6)-dimethylallyltransferase MiaA [bacterium]
MPFFSHAWILAGATATGKTAVAQVLAEQLGCAILSADSMLVYRGMDIGTAKPTLAERGNVPYFGIDQVTPAEPFSTGAWLAAAARAVSTVETVSRTVCGSPPEASLSEPSLIVVGGTGLYIKALTSGFDSEEADPARRAHWQALFERDGLAALQHALGERAPAALESLADPSNPRRLIRALEHLDAHGRLPQNWQSVMSPATILALRLPRKQLHHRIGQRVTTMFRQGLVDEVRALRHTCPVWSATALQAIGYAEVCAWLDGKFTEQVAVETIMGRTRQLAKRQETWFRHQTQTVWLDIDETDPPALIAQRVLTLWRQHGPTPILSP